MSILKEINPEYLLEGLMLKLKFQYFGHFMQKSDSLKKKKKKNLMLGKIEGKRRSGQKWKRWLDSITHSTDMYLSKLWEIVKDRGAWHSAVHGVTESDVSWGLKNNSKGLRLCLQGLSCLPLNSQRSPFQAWWMSQIP